MSKCFVCSGKDPRICFPTEQRLLQKWLLVLKCQVLNHLVYYKLLSLLINLLATTFCGEPWPKSVDLRENVTSIDNTLVVIRNMTGDQTQEIVDECPERPPRTSTPVPGHNEEIGGLFLNTTDLMLREHSYSSVSRAGSVSFSESQNMRQSVKSVSGYHSLSVSELEGAEADQSTAEQNKSRVGTARYFDKEAVTKDVTPEETETTEESSLTSATSEASSEMRDSSEMKARRDRVGQAGIDRNQRVCRG